MTIVVKIGGSLLDWAELPSRLNQLLHQRPDVRPVFIIGGGAAANAVRQWGRTFSLSEPACHDLALQAMDVTAALLTKILPGSLQVQAYGEAESCWKNGNWPVLRVADWLRPPSLSPLPRGGGEGQGEGASASRRSKPLSLTLSPSRGEGTNPSPAALDDDDITIELPQSWAVTSDSLAAWVAQKWRADELWLLKSTDLPTGISFAEASRRGLVDEFFPCVARWIPSISWCNLRTGDPGLNPFGEANVQQLGEAGVTR